MAETHRRHDVAVVGGGMAGWVAASAAKEHGADVVLLERSKHRPGWGNSLVSGGVLHAAMHDPRRPPDELVGFILEATDGECDRSVVEAWAANAAPTLEWVANHGGVLVTDPADEFLARVLSPVRPLTPGLPRGGVGMAEFLGGLAQRFTRSGGTLFQPARAVGLERSGGGWIIETSGSTPVRVAATTVVLADGGFQANRALLRRYVGTDRVKRRATATATGDGLRMGLAAGGVAVQMKGFYGHLLSSAASSRADLWPYPLLDGVAAAGIVVSPAGERLVDETHSGVTTTNEIAWSKDPLGHTVICDDCVWQGVGTYGTTPPNPYIETHGGPVFHAPDVGRLADLSGIDRRGLERSVAEVRTDPAGARPARSAAACLDHAPFHAVPVIAGVTFTLGGLRVDGRARVLDASARPLPGLYAAGGTMGGLHGGPRVGYGGGLLEAAIFGRIAGEDAAGAGIGNKPE